MKVYYRISDGSYNKSRQPYITKKNCLINFVKTLREEDSLNIIADNVSQDTFEMITKVAPSATIYRTSLGHGALSFKYCVSLAAEDTVPNNTILYFVEDDYFHKPNALEIIQDGIEVGFDYITGYDHPDKYMSPEQGGNPYCEGNSEASRVYLGRLSHFKITNSTTMTFALTKNTLLEDKELLDKHTQVRYEQGYPYDFYLFRDLQSIKNRILGSSIPGVSTHGDTKWMSPLTDWSLFV